VGVGAWSPLTRGSVTACPGWRAQHVAGAAPLLQGGVCMLGQGFDGGARGVAGMSAAGDS